jgi:hypothetical protein
MVMKLRVPAETRLARAGSSRSNQAMAWLLEEHAAA